MDCERYSRSLPDARPDHQLDSEEGQRQQRQPSPPVAPPRQHNQDDAYKRRRHHARHRAGELAHAPESDQRSESFEGQFEQPRASYLDLHIRLRRRRLGHVLTLQAERQRSVPAVPCFDGSLWCAQRRPRQSPTGGPLRALRCRRRHAPQPRSRDVVVPGRRRRRLCGLQRLSPQCAGRPTASRRRVAPAGSAPSHRLTAAEPDRSHRRRTQLASR